MGWKMKNLHQKLMLGDSSLVGICVFCSCWALLMEGAISRLVTDGLKMLSDVLKEDVMRQVHLLVDAAPPLHRLPASHLLLPPPLAHPLLLPPLPQLPLLDGRLCPPDRLVPRSPPGVRHPLQPLQD